MGLLKLYFDTTSKSLVSGIDDATPYQLPNYRQGDTPVYDITMLRRVKTRTPWFERVSFGGWTATMALGSAANSITSGISSSLSTDNFTFTDLALPLTTAGVNSLADGATVWMELQFTEAATGRYFGQRFDSIVQKAVIVPGAVTTAAVDRALALSEAQAGYVTYRMPAGRGLELVSADGTKTALIFIDNDGTVHGLT